MLVTKSDLLAVLDDFEPAKAEQAVRQLAIEAPVSLLSAKSGEGVQEWLDWLDEQVKLQAERRKAGDTATPSIQPDGQHLHAHG